MRFGAIFPSINPLHTDSNIYFVSSSISLNSSTLFCLNNKQEYFGQFERHDSSSDGEAEVVLYDCFENKKKSKPFTHSIKSGLIDSFSLIATKIDKEGVSKRMIITTGNHIVVKSTTRNNNKVPETTIKRFKDMKEAIKYLNI